MLQAIYFPNAAIRQVIWLFHSGDDGGVVVHVDLLLAVRSLARFVDLAGVDWDRVVGDGLVTAKRRIGG